MNHSYDDTIFSLATSLGRSATAMLRVSGPQANILSSVFGFEMPEPRVAGLRILKEGTRRLDQAIVLFFKGPKSYTGEDLVELHVHGGKAVVRAIEEVLEKQDGFRMAENGEFSRRAVINGRIDLTVAEGINDLINAQTEEQRAQGLRQAEGGLVGRLDGWSHNIKIINARIEAYIDFPDEGIPEKVLKAIQLSVCETAFEMEVFVDDGRRGEILRDGFRVAIIGPPNVGKSSFVNWVAKRDVAITSEFAGTTRDVIEVHLNLNEYPVIVADTAGLREAESVLEAEGIKRAMSWARDADLRVLVLDGQTESEFSGYSELLMPEDLTVINKIDDEKGLETNNRGWLKMSVNTGEGLGLVLERIGCAALAKMSNQSPSIITQSRHRTAIKSCILSLHEAKAGLINGLGLELVAEDLRSATHSLGRITGRVDVEDLLDIIFKEFCIGK
jgi:tRNA modification GTPase